MSDVSIPASAVRPKRIRQQTGITILPEVLNQLDQIAAENKRSRSNQVEWLISQEWQKRVAVEPHAI